MAEVGTAWVTLVPAAKGFGTATEKQVGGEMSTSGKRLGSRLGSAIKVGALAAIGGAILVGKFFSDAVGEASDLNETINKSNAIFGKNAQSIRKWSKGSAEAFGLSQSESLAAAAGFGDMFSQIGFTGKQTASMSKDVVGLAADLGSFNNLETSDVLDRISAAMRGEYDSLQAVIPNINAARVENEALAATGKKSAKELTAQEKAAATLAIVHQDGARAAGDFARTSGSLANQQKILGAKFDDVKATVGTALLPVVNRLFGFLIDTAIPAAQRLATWLGDHLGPAAASAGGFFRTKVLPVLQDLGHWVMDKLVPALQDMARDVLPEVKKYMGQAGKAFDDAKPFLKLVGDIIVDVLIPGIGKLAKFALPFMAAQLRTTAKVLGAVGKAGKWLWNNALQPVFKLIAESVARAMKMWGEMFQLIGRVPGMGWVGDLGDKLVGAADKAHNLAQNIKDIPDSKTVSLNVNENWVTTRTVRGNGGGFGPQGLASGGIVSRPTLALVGEGRESEAVMPLSKLSAMLDRERAAGSGARSGGNTFHLYDADGVLLGSMRGVVKGDRDNTAMRRRAGAAG